MKAKNLRATAVAGLKRAHMRLEERVSVVLGGPASGKSSVRDALTVALLGTVTPRAGPTDAQDHLLRVELDFEGHRVVVGPRAGPVTDRRALRRAIGDEMLVSMLLDPMEFLDAEPWMRKRLVVGSVSLDPATLLSRLRALGIPGHHGVIDAQVGNIPSALARVRAALAAVVGRLVRVSEPEDPVVETPRGTCRVSTLPPVADLEAALAPLIAQASALGADLPAPTLSDVVAIAAMRSERAEGERTARAEEKQALGWTIDDERTYEARIPKMESAKGALAVAEARAAAFAQCVAYLADLEDADQESCPTCPTCRHRPNADLRTTLLRHRTSASNDLGVANKAVWEAREVLKGLTAASTLIETRAAAFTVAESALEGAEREAAEAKRALEAIVADRALQEKVRAELLALRERVTKGQALIALRSTYDAARETFARAEASRLSLEAEAQRYRDAERLLVSAADGVSDVELGGVVGTFNAALASSVGALFQTEIPVVTVTPEWEVLLRGVRVSVASSSERVLASIACGHALAMLSEKNFLVVDGLERVGYEHVDRVLGWLLEVGEAYDNLIVTLVPNGVTPEAMAAARTHALRPHVSYYPIRAPGVIEPIAREEQAS